MQSLEWQQAIKEARKEAASTLDRIALEEALKIVKTNFPNSDVPSIFTGPDRCEIQWENGESFITFGNAESNTCAFSVRKDKKLFGKPVVMAVPLSSLRPPLHRPPEEQPS
jgi:hypothetical protein